LPHIKLAEKALTSNRSQTRPPSATTSANLPAKRPLAACAASCLLRAASSLGAIGNPQA